MNFRAVFVGKVCLPLWPLFPLLLLGVIDKVRVHSYLEEVSGIVTVIGLSFVAIRYWWAWIHGAPWFDWIVLFTLLVSMEFIATAFVGHVQRLLVP